jgi:hypothetical protein
MSREIRVASEDPQLAAAGAADGYLAKLVKYIPGEIIAGYLAADGIVRSSISDDQDRLESYLWIFLVVGLFLTPLYLWRVAKVSKVVQIALATVSFAAWVFGVGGAFSFTDWYEPFQGGLVVIGATLVIPIIDP